MLRTSLFALSVWAATAQAGNVVFNGIFNSSATVANFDKWSWSNQIQPWQWYIHGSGATSKYLGLSSSFKNPADTSSAQGLRTTIDGTAFWNGQTMERTEIIPQTSTNIGTGHLYYHFSISTSSTNPPSSVNEHQIAFFESHFTELKYGTLSGASGADNNLRWMINGQTKWSTQLSPGTWYNFAYDIDFSSNTVGLWASTGSDALKQVVANQAASTSTNSADFHIGVLRLPNGGTSTAAEDFFWSGIYIETAPITTSIAGPFPGQGGTAPPVTSTTTKPPTSSSTTSTTTYVDSTTQPTTSTTTSAPSTPTGPTAAHYGQCGGTNWTGPTVCESPYTCKAISPPYYYQCL